MSTIGQPERALEEAEQARIKAMKSPNGAAAAVSAITAKANWRVCGVKRWTSTVRALSAPSGSAGRAMRMSIRVTRMSEVRSSRSDTAPQPVQGLPQAEAALTVTKLTMACPRAMARSSILNRYPTCDRHSEALYTRLLSLLGVRICPPPRSPPAGQGFSTSWRLEALGSRKLGAESRLFRLSEESMAPFAMCRIHRGTRFS